MVKAINFAIALLLLSGGSAIADWASPIPIPEPKFQDKCLEAYYATSRNEMRKTTCDTYELAKYILAASQEKSTEEIVPKHLFHYGRKADLIANAHFGPHGGISQEVWDKYVMPGKSKETRYNLPNVRQGLYGTTGIDTNPYGFNEFSWLMEITVKDECRRASGLITFPELTEQKLFIDWFLQKNTKQDLQKFTSECMGWTSDYYRVFQTERCQDIVQTFLQEKDVKVLQDAASQKSFYLRDRNCIESIRATPLQILEMHGDRPELWITSCNEYAQPTRGDILLRALYEVEQPVDAGLMERLKLNLRLLAAASDFYKLWPSMLSEALKAHERCLSGRDFGIATFQKAMTPFLDRLAASKNPPQMEWTAADISVIKKTCVP